MTSLEAIAKLQLLLDKTGSPYFTTDEYLSFLNMAQNEWLNRLVPDSLGGVVNFELDQNTYFRISPLVVIRDLQPDSQSGDSGIFSTASVVNAVRSTTGDSTCGLFSVISLGISSGNNPTFLPVKYVKSNNLFVAQGNTFKRPSSSNYVYSFDYTGFRVQPYSSKFHRFTVLKTPKLMTAVNSPDLDDYSMNQVIQVAYQLSTVATRDEAGLQLGTNTTIQAK